MLAKMMARQLGNPSGLIGRFLGRMWNKRNSTLNDVAYDALSLTAADRVLEVGFGGGYLLGRMSRIVTTGQISGVDISAAMVSACQQRYAGLMDLRIGTAEQLPFPDAHFTTAVSVNSIFYWTDAAQAMSELARVLMKGGRLILCFTDERSLQQKDFAHHGLKLFTGESARQLLEAAQFSAIRLAQHTDQHRRFWCVTASRA